MNDFAGIAQLRERRGATANTPPEVAGENPAPRSTPGRGPWAISDAAAAARAAAVDWANAALVARIIHPDMPAEAILFKLARYGIDAADWRRLRARLVELSHG